MGGGVAQGMVADMALKELVSGTRRTARAQWNMVALVLAFAVCMLYVSALEHEYVWDDLLYLGDYRGAAGAARALTEHFFFDGYYRPLALLSFVPFDEPTVQHTINVLLHAANTVLVFWCARALMPCATAQSCSWLAAAAFGALVFAMHPVGVEAVAWVSGRFDTLMCSFVLGACLVGLGGELTRRRLALVFVLFFAAMCSKESAAGLPVALPFLLLLKWRLAGAALDVKGQWGRIVRLLAVLALAAALYVAARLAVTHTMFAGDAPVVFRSQSLVDKLNIAALAVAEFAKLLVNPWSHSAPLHPFSYEAGSGLLLRTVVVLGAVLALLALAGFKKWSFPLALLAGLAMGWPALHIIGIPNRENIISDRYALAPLALQAAALAAAAGTWLARRLSAMRAWERRVPLYAGVACLLWVGALAAHSHTTIPFWHDDINLWQFAYQQVPNSVQAHENYVTTLMQQGRWKEAETELHKFWDKYPERFQNMKLKDMIVWMVLRSNLGDRDSALQLSDMIEEKLDDEQKSKATSAKILGVFYVNRGMLAGNMGDWVRACDYFVKAIQVCPEDMEHMFRYAQALFMTGQPKKADEVFNRALAGSTKDLAAWALEWRKEWGIN